MFSGTVKSILEAKYIVADELGRILKTSRAVSCLIEPEIGDRVLVGDTGDCVYILAVLERQAASGSIAWEGDLKMSLPKGKLKINAKEGISLGTPEELILAAGKVGLSGESLAAAFKKIDMFGDTVYAHLDDLKMFSSRLQSKVGSAVQHFVKRHAAVESIDSVKAGTIKQTAKNIMSLKSMFSFIKSEKNVKIDGKQIFLA